MSLRKTDSHQTIASNDNRFAFYADGAHVSLKEAQKEIEKNNGKDISVLILHEEEDKEYIEWADHSSSVQQKLKFMQNITRNKEKFIIYSKEELSFR